MTRISWEQAGPEPDPIPAAAALKTIGVFKGQIWEWRPAGAASAVQCVVTRRAKDGSWADLRCYSGSGNSWSKRQYLPFPDTFWLTHAFLPS